MRAKRWYLKFPQDAYALGPVEFADPVTAEKAREYAREWEGVKRLPRGFQCWPAGDRSHGR